MRHFLLQFVTKLATVESSPLVDYLGKQLGSRPLLKNAREWFELIETEDDFRTVRLAAAHHLEENDRIGVTEIKATELPGVNENFIEWAKGRHLNPTEPVTHKQRPGA